MTTEAVDLFCDLVAKPSQDQKGQQKRNETGSDGYYGDTMDAMGKLSGLLANFSGNEKG
jgi:hypothetical protein